MKLCKDCKHFVPSVDFEPIAAYAFKYAICATTSVIDGTDGVMCKDMRKWSIFNRCGPSAKLFEPKS